MDLPKISVIIPTYNRSHYIGDAIESVMAQTYKNWEIIVVDDASDDNTMEVIHKYKDQIGDKLVYFRMDTNSDRHLGVPRNVGIKAATGDLIAFLDSDCEFRPDHLQALYKEMERNPEISGVYGDRMMVDDTGEHPDTPGITGDWSVRRLLHENYIDTSDVLIKKSALLSVGGWDETIRKFADWNLWVRLGKGGHTMRRVPIILTNYHVHAGMNQLAVPGTIKDLFDPIHCRIWAEKSSLAERPKLKVAVYTLCMDRKDYTDISFKSMRAKTKYPFTHVVVNQGSKEYDAAYLQSLGDNIVLLDRETNIGISAGSNVAVEYILNHTDADIIIKVDNDAKFLTDGWLEAVVDVFERVRGYAVSPYVEGLIDHPGGVPRRRLDNPQMSPYAYIGKNLIGFAPHIGGIFVACMRDVYENFRWVEKDFYHGVQDFEFSQYCLKQGYALAYMENVKIEHMEISEVPDREQGKVTDYFKHKSEILKHTKYGE